MKIVKIISGTVYTIVTVSLFGISPTYAGGTGRATSCLITLDPIFDNNSIGGFCWDANTLNTNPGGGANFSADTGVGNTSGATTINGTTTTINGTETNINATNDLSISSSSGTVFIKGGRGGSNPDVQIESANYDGLGTGSAIIVTDNGVQVISPTPTSGVTYYNNFGANNSVNGGTIVNNFGGGDGATQNSIGNTNKDTQNTITAGGSQSNMGDGYNTSITQVKDAAASDAFGGTSILGGSTVPSGASGTVMKGVSGLTTTVNANGKIEAPTNSVASEATAFMTITNGAGNTHGYFVNEHQATMSGGINSSSMTLADNGATFSNSATGEPIQVHGVDDGTAPFDAVNIRQLYGAVAASMATVPNFTVEPGETGIGFGTATMGQYPAIGMSFAKKNKNGSQINIGVAAAEHVPLAVRAGVGWVW